MVSPLSFLTPKPTWIPSDNTAPIQDSSGTTPPMKNPMQMIMMMIMIMEIMAPLIQMMSQMGGSMKGGGLGGLGGLGDPLQDPMGGMPNPVGGSNSRPSHESDPLGWNNSDDHVSGANSSDGTLGGQDDASQPNDMIMQLIMMIMQMLQALTGQNPFGEEEGEGGHCGGGGGGGGGGHGGGKTHGGGHGGGKTHGGDDDKKTGGGGGAGDVNRTANANMPPATGEETVNETIVVKAGETFDGGGKLYKAGASLGDGSQSEGQKPIFILEDGATLKNVQLEGADGVHTYGDATLNDVWWKDVGEDALTVKDEGNVVINGGGAFNASDKIFQVNAGGSLTVNGFYADTFGKVVRTNGGKEITTDITIRNSTFLNGDESIVRTDSSTAMITLDNVETDGSERDLIRSDYQKNVTIS